MKKDTERTRLGARRWLSFIALGLAGQFAWTIENMYFNVFLYNTISDDPGYIAAMVAASAAAATLTTLVMGTMSDRAGRRKVFIVAGYLLWGLSTAAFGLITVQNASALFPSHAAAAAAAWTVVVMDCVMTFFGSTANDAAFNAYITDSTDPTNRGRVETILATLPLLSMLIIFGAFDGMTQRGEWQKFFLIFGGAVTLTGLLALFLVEDTPAVKSNASALRDLLYGFQPSVIRQNRSLYLALTSYMVASVAVQVFFPYLIVYMQHGLGLTNYAVVLAVALIAALAASVLSGFFADRIGTMRCVLPSAATMLAGLVLMYFARGMAFVIAAGCVLMSGYIVLMAMLSAAVRDRTPKDKAGMFQGIRMIFSVLVPMVIGPFIGAAVIKNNPNTYNDLGTIKNVPTPAIFLAAAAVLLLVTIPALALKRSEERKK